MKKLKEVWQDFVEFITYNPFNLRSFCEKIVGTLEYTKFIWKHDIYREWDFEYLYDFLDFKLRRMALQLKKDSFVESSQQTYEEILKTLAYLQLYQKGESSSSNDLNIDVIRHKYNMQQDAWCKFHDSLRDNAQKWWS